MSEALNEIPSESVSVIDGNRQTKKEASIGFLCYFILFANLAGSRLVSQISAT